MLHLFLGKGLKLLSEVRIGSSRRVVLKLLRHAELLVVVAQKGIQKGWGSRCRLLSLEKRKKCQSHSSSFIM